MKKAEPQDKRTAYKTEWDRVNTKQYKLKLMKTTDSDIIEFLESLPNRQGYIKDLIRADMKKETTK